MRIRWENIIGLLVVAFLVYLFIHLRPFMAQFIEELNCYWYWPDRPIWKFNLLAIVCLTFLAAIKLFINR